MEPLVKATLSICPQLVVLGSPNPKKLRLASARTANATDIVIHKKATGITLGRMCTRMM
jgi:hypothetical protein